jgi:hypothetical protein
VEYLIYYLLRFGHKFFTKLYFLFTRVIRKVGKTQHQNPEFSHTQGEILKKKPAEKYISIQRGMELRKSSILVLNWVSSCLSFFLSASTAATYIFSAPNCTTTIISLEPCALHAEHRHFILSCSISYWDLSECLYFADTTERGDRGWKEAQRQGEERVTLRINSIFTVFILIISQSPEFFFW